MTLNTPSPVWLAARSWAVQTQSASLTARESAGQAGGGHAEARRGDSLESGAGPGLFPRRLLAAQLRHPCGTWLNFSNPSVALSRLVEGVSWPCLLRGLPAPALSLRGTDALKEGAGLGGEVAPGPEGITCQALARDQRSALLSPRRSGPPRLQ